MTRPPPQNHGKANQKPLLKESIRMVRIDTRLIIPNVGREQLQLADITGGSENNTVTLENSKFLKMKLYIYLP